MSKWISVKDRLPEDKRLTLYWHINFGPSVGFYDPTHKKNGYHWWSTKFGDNADASVTHWMPLPEPPKEDK